MDEQLYLMAVGLSLEEKVENTIETFRTFEPAALKRDPVNGYYLCDSYGKDSCVILDLAKRSGVKFQAHHNLTTLDPPELVLFGRHNHPETVVHKPKIPMLKYMETSTKGAPTRICRWCCAIYKESAGGGSVRVTGVRAAESARRKAMWRVLQPRREADSFMLNPILFWTDEDIWRHLRSQKIPYCSLYDEGWNRLGCVGCPMAHGVQRMRDFKRWPKIEAGWKRAFARTLENMSHKRRPDGTQYAMNTTWKTPEEMWDWWMEENQPEAEDDCQMGLF